MNDSIKKIYELQSALEKIGISTDLDLNAK